ncbi:hypothetical protein H0H92_014494 [Tricholoma furcatifolium]|nr:hypothetical protein H0H92_014494 [Tricholoma furcatifolium]
MDPRRALATGVNVENVNPQELFDVLNAASSQDPSQLQPSSKRLKEMLDMFGTYDALSDIATQRSCSLAVRQQAIIQFKNSALSHWRSRKLLNDEHRTRIRNRFLTLLDEEDETITHFNEVIVAKIARQDFPNNWGNLVNDLLATADLHLQKRYVSMSEDPRDLLTLQRSFKLLNIILKEFASIKMLNGIKTMANLVNSLHPIFYQYYSQLASTISSSTVTPQSLHSPRIYGDILLSHLAYKCLVKMTGWLWNRIDKVSQEEQKINQSRIQDLFQNSAIQLKSLTTLRTDVIMGLIQANSASDPQVQRSIDILTRHVRVFGKFFRRLQQLSPARFVALPTCSDLILYYWSQVVRATGEAPSLVSGKHTKLQHIEAQINFSKDSNQAAYPDFIRNAVELLVTRFMPLNPKDLENWVADPEEWVNVEDKENDLWEYEIRMVTYASLNDISKAQQPASNTSDIDLQVVLQKEAIYCALGRCATRVKDVIPFNEWLERSLAVEAQDNNPKYPLIKRRIAWLIGKWVSDASASPNNPKLWEVLVHLLKDRGPGTDYVVRLTAVGAIKECLDTVEFQTPAFAPYLPTVVTELIAMMGEADTFDSKRRIDHTLNVVIEQVGQLAIINLDDDGLTLWLAALRNTLTVSSVNGAPALLELFPLALELLSTNFDLMGKTISIVESYLLLDASGILQVCGVQLFTAMLVAFKSDSIMSTNATELMRALNLLLQVSPSNLWAEALHSSGLFGYLLTTLIEGEASTLLLTEHVLFLSRVAVVDSGALLKLIAATGETHRLKEDYLYDNMFDQWFGKFDNMSEPRSRKLTSLGVAAMVSTAHPEVLKRLPVEIFNLWIDVFYEMKEAPIQSEDDNDSSYSLVKLWDLKEAPHSFYEETEGTPECDRRKAVYDRDPVRTVHLGSYVASRIREAEATCGAAAFQAQYLSKADPTLLSQIQVELARV